MKIETVRIENFRGFLDETISFDDYVCFVGPNGSGKSTILAALNVFFRQYKDSKTDLSKLSKNDFHHKNVKDPIRITVTFCDLSEAAKLELSGYVRQEKLIVSAIAKYDPLSERAEVRQFGSRLGMRDFASYFDADKRGETVADLKDIYADLRLRHPELEDAKTKAAMASALQNFEANKNDACELLESEDQFYGATKGVNRLAPHIQWVFVPAVKDITEESQESKTSGLGQLLSRTVRAKVNFAEQVVTLQNSLRREYQSMLDAEQSILDGLSGSLEMKLKDWAHPAVTARVRWTQDADRSVRVDEPWAYVQIGERGFEGELARFGHGMQRSFMLTLLQELASGEESNAPTLVLAIEEPELYQHPPQARYLAEVLHDLASESAQIVVCSHSPMFIPGNDFEAVRVVRDSGMPSCSSVSQLAYKNLADILQNAGQKLLKEQGMLAKLYPAFNPGINEMFFCRVLVLVEGAEDLAHLSTYLSLLNLMPSFRKNGCHIVPVGNKSNLIKPVAMAKQLDIPVFVVVDADTDSDPDKPNVISAHKRDNKSLLALMGYESESDWPTEHIWKSDFVMWQHNLTKLVEDEIGANWHTHEDAAAAYYGQPGYLKKNPLAISRAQASAWEAGHRSASLAELAGALVRFAENAIRS